MIVPRWVQGGMCVVDIVGISFLVRHSAHPDSSVDGEGATLVA